MALKYRKNYTTPYSKSNQRMDDYWLEWWDISGKRKSCLNIPVSIPSRLVAGKEDFFLLAMNKKRDVLDRYKRSGQDAAYFLYCNGDA